MDTTLNTLTETLRAYQINGEIIRVVKGPRVTRYDLIIDKGIKVNKVKALQTELAIAVKAPFVRVHPMPEDGVIGIEVPNEHASPVRLADFLSSEAWKTSRMWLPLAVGLDSAGREIVIDLVDQPHLLVAGSTGSGKSVAITSMIDALMTARTPEELKFVLVDPKKVELSAYEGMPHLLNPVITEAPDVVQALDVLIAKMELRYDILKQASVVNAEEYYFATGQYMQRIVLVIDEMADLMLGPYGKAVEERIIRLAQKSRAAGIHIIAATQRPVVKVVTGLIKANFPARMAFRVPAMVDSKTILDMPGAEELLGKGDMLFITPSYPEPLRVQGVYVDYATTLGIVQEMKETYQPVRKPRGEGWARKVRNFFYVSPLKLARNVAVIFLATNFISCFV